jgi:hypothetical protein
VILRAHVQKQHFDGLKHIFKPTTSGGLSYILVPNNFTADKYPYNPAKTEEWEIIHEHDDLQQYIQIRNI